VELHFKYGSSGFWILEDGPAFISDTLDRSGPKLRQVLAVQADHAAKVLSGGQYAGHLNRVIPFKTMGAIQSRKSACVRCIWYRNATPHSETLSGRLSPECLALHSRQSEKLPKKPRCDSPAELRRRCTSKEGLLGVGCDSIFRLSRARRIDHVMLMIHSEFFSTVQPHFH